MDKPITALMEREMSRKEFLTTLGFGIASILGFSNIIRLLTGKSLDSHSGASRTNLGYGSSVYGGGKER